MTASVPPSSAALEAEFEQDASGALIVVDRADGVTTGQITATGQTVTAPVIAGMASVIFATSGTYAAPVWSSEVSFDGGTTYWPLQAELVSSATQLSTVAFTGAVNGSQAYVAAIPPGATHVRMRVTTFTTGTMNVTIAQTPAPLGVSIIGGVGLGATGARIGGVQRAAVWYDDTSTPLAAAGTFTGTTRDAIGAGTGVTNGIAWPTFRSRAISDVAGTLHLEVSRDNSTFRRIESVATAAAASGLHVAAIADHPVATRYVRVVFVNGAGAQTHFQLQSVLL
jgi:hypothetical protein